MFALVPMQSPYSCLQKLCTSQSDFIKEYNKFKSRDSSFPKKLSTDLSIYLSLYISPCFSAQRNNFITCSTDLIPFPWKSVTCTGGRELGQSTPAAKRSCSCLLALVPLTEFTSRSDRQYPKFQNIFLRCTRFKDHFPNVVTK